MEDFTGDCLATAFMTGENRKLTEPELREMCCKFCASELCGHARLNKSQWVSRMSTQEERLLKNPKFADLKNPKWFAITDLDFPNLERQAIKLDLASIKADWSIPTEAEIEAELALQRFTPPPEAPPEMVDEPELKTVVIESKSRPGTRYTVQIGEDGEAVSCDCRAGQFGRRCTHQQWAEEQVAAEKATQRVSNPVMQNAPWAKDNTPPRPSERNQRIVDNKLSGVRRNTQAPSTEASLLGSYIKPKGSAASATDDWSKPAPKVVSSGHTIVIKRNNNE